MSNETSIRDRIELTIRRRIDARDDEFCATLINQAYCIGCGDVQLHYMCDLDAIFDGCSASEILGSIDMGYFDLDDKYFADDGIGFLRSWNETRVVDCVKNRLDWFIGFCYDHRDECNDLIEN